MGALLQREAAGAAAPLLRAARGVPGERRLQIYRNNQVASLGAALSAVYPVVARLVGEGFFRQLARGYVALHPSRAGNLHEFGRELPDFLRAEASLAAWPYLGDVAALEWACHEVYHEADAAALDPAALGDVPEDAQAHLCLYLQPAARLVASPWPVLAIWQANQAGVADDDAIPVSLDDGGQQLLVARRAWQIEFRLLGDAEARWLGALAAGRPLASALAAALEVDATFDLGAALGRHLRLGSFCACTFAAGREQREGEPA
jgi:hypothetical protein